MSAVREAFRETGKMSTTVIKLHIWHEIEGEYTMPAGKVLQCLQLLLIVKVNC